MAKKIQRLVLIALVALVCTSSYLAQRQSRADLQARAKSSKGALVWKYRPSQALVYPNIEELAKRSAIVIVGRTLGHRSHLSKDGMFVTQDFLVRVQEVFKGDVKNGASMLISLPGGSHKFADGSHVQVMAVGYKQAEDGASYVFFLKDNSDTNFKGYPLASDTQGLFALKDKKVEPAYAGPSDPIALKSQGMETVSFLQQLRAISSPVVKK